MEGFRTVSTSSVGEMLCLIVAETELATKDFDFVV